MRNAALATLLLPFFGGLLLIACQDTPDEPTPGGNASAATSAPAAAASASTGLAAAGNDEAIVAAAQKTLTCKWSAAGLASNCKDLKTWRAEPALKSGQADATLLNMLDDQDAKVRWLAATTLKAHGKAFREDKALAARVLAAAEKENDATVASHMGSTVARIDLAKTGTEARVKTLIESHKSPALRQAVVRSILYSNRDLLFDYMMNLARNSKDGQMRKAAAAAFWTGTPTGKHQEACKLWLDLAAESDSDLAGNASYHCAFYPHDGGCQSQWDALLTTIEKKATEGKVASTMTASALEYLYGQKAASDAQKKRAIEIAKKLAENPANKSTARGRAIEIVAKWDAKGKAFAKKFEADKDGYVQSVAKRAQITPTKQR